MGEIAWNLILFVAAYVLSITVFSLVLYRCCQIRVQISSNMHGVINTPGHIAISIPFARVDNVYVMAAPTILGNPTQRSSIAVELEDIIEDDPSYHIQSFTSLNFEEPISFRNYYDTGAHQ